MNFDAERMKRLERDGYNLIGRRYAAARARGPTRASTQSFFMSGSGGSGSPTFFGRQFCTTST